MKVLSSAQMREIDRVGIEQNLPLMENAGTAVARFVLEEFPEAHHIQVVCGKGNNGGDGRIAAQRLQEAGKEVEVFDASSEFELTADLVIDAVLGSGFKPPVGGVYLSAIDKINQYGGIVVALDVPSGTDADQVKSSQVRSSEVQSSKVAARADAVITFTAPRPAHVFANLTRGPLAVAAIGIAPAALANVPSELEVITPLDFAPALQARNPDSNKGSYGHVLVIGGARGKAGAPAMAAMAALRAGAGLVTVAVPQTVQATVSGFAPELMTEGLNETDAGSIALNALDYGRLESLLDGKNVVAIGPGLGRHAETAAFVRSLLQRLTDPKCRKSGQAKLCVVLDADGLNAFEGETSMLQGDNITLIVTPHPGEMARLAGLSIAQVQADRINVARKFSDEHKCTVVLKGHRTIICFPSGTHAAEPRLWVNTSGNPGMATGGTGDILTGITAGLLAQAARASSKTGDDNTPTGADDAADNHAETAAAVQAAVYLHGAAGDIAASGWGEGGLMATDLLATLHHAFAAARRSLNSGFTYLQPGRNPDPEL